MEGKNLDAKQVTESIIQGKEIRKAISESFFSNLVIELGDEINANLNNLKAEDPLFNDTEQKSYAKNKKALDDFLAKIKEYGVPGEDIVKNFTQGKDNVRWADVWNDLLANITK